MSSTPDALERLWPLFGLVLRCEDVVLHVARDEEIAALADAVREQGVHDPARSPFLSAWTDPEPPELERGVLRWRWRQRAEWDRADWILDFTVSVHGEPVGVQGLLATDFATRRVVDTGSWLLLPAQGRGIGKKMRTAVLALAFDRLGAMEARSGAFDDNPASARVSEALGYEGNGDDVVVVRGERRIERRFRLTRDDWLARPRPTVEVNGLDACRDMFGATVEPR